MAEPAEKYAEDGRRGLCQAAAILPGADGRM